MAGVPKNEDLNDVVIESTFSVATRIFGVVAFFNKRHDPANAAHFLDDRCPPALPLV
jgi:hypothetical protein